MARLKFGPWGAIIGKLGNTIGYIRKGIPVLRMRPHPSTKKRTVGQKATTQRFQLIIKFMPMVNDFTNIGFRMAAKNTTKTAQNLAVSYNTKNAIKGEYPDQEIDFTKLRLCEGKLPLPANIEITTENLGNEIRINYNWDMDASIFYARKRDQVMMLAYLPEYHSVKFLDSGARRSELHDHLVVKRNHGSVNLPQMATYAEVYIAFISNDRESISNSLYCGKVDF